MKSTFNINGWVFVRLTDVGIRELERQHDELRKSLPKIGAFTPPKVDDDGYTKFQLHDLMSRLGHLCQLGFEIPFDPEIKIKIQKNNL